MGLLDKFKNSAKKAKGNVKEATGDATDNDRMKAEGRVEHAEGSFKQAGENVKDTLDE